jgi:hypothetical protein
MACVVKVELSYVIGDEIDYENLDALFSEIRENIRVTSFDPNSITQVPIELTEYQTEAEAKAAWGQWLLGCSIDRALTGSNLLITQSSKTEP